MRVTLFLSVLVMFLSGCDPFDTALGPEDVTYYVSDDIESFSGVSDTLGVMTWNIKFGGGRIDFFFDCHGDRVIMDSSEVQNHLKGISAFLRHEQPDVLFVQEIDVNSKRSAYVDQVQWLLDHTAFNYAVYSPQWKADYIPSEGLGKMNSGNAVFSRFPLFKAQRISLPLIEEQNFLVRYFYLKRCLLDVSVVVGGDTLRLMNTHLAAYSSDGTKKKQIDRVYKYADSLNHNQQKLIVAGDFNSLPPGTRKVKGFPDSACADGDFEADDYSGEEDWMNPFYQTFQPAVTHESYISDNALYFTHTTDGEGFWNRKVDYIFSNLPVVPGSGRVFQQSEKSEINPMSLSDHCAVAARIVLE